MDTPPGDQARFRKTVPVDSGGAVPGFNFAPARSGNDRKALQRYLELWRARMAEQEAQEAREAQEAAETEPDGG